jgi:uncharacterized protein (TIGR00730 family)
LVHKNRTIRQSHKNDHRKIVREFNINSRKIISIFGTSKASPESAAYEAAFRLGKQLAHAGFAIANGGYGGTMLASAEAASKAGGEVIGVTCTAFKRGKANEYVSREISTNSLNERLNKLIELGDGYVVLPGSTGTLLELAAVWELKNKGFLDGGKPIILLGEFWRPLVELMAAQDLENADCIEIAATTADVVEMLKKLNK